MLELLLLPTTNQYKDHKKDIFVTNTKHTFKSNLAASVTKWFSISLLSRVWG